MCFHYYYIIYLSDKRDAGNQTTWETVTLCDFLFNVKRTRADEIEMFLMVLLMSYTRRKVMGTVVVVKGVNDGDADGDTKGGDSDNAVRMGKGITCMVLMVVMIDMKPIRMIVITIMMMMMLTIVVGAHGDSENHGK